MSTIAPIGTATQLCEWMGVPETSIRPVMAKLHQAGLETIVSGRHMKSAPSYNTAQAFKIYFGLTRQLLPDAAHYLRRVIEAEQAAAQQTAEAQAEADRVRAEAEEAQREEQAEKTRQRIEERAKQQAPAREQAQQEVEARALDRDLATYYMIARRYDQLDSNGKIKAAFTVLLNRNGLVQVDHDGPTKLFGQKAADTAVRASKLSVERKRPKRDWTGVEIEDEEELPRVNPKLWSAEAFLKDKMIDGEAIDPGDYYTIERELNTSYFLVPASDLGLCKLYRHADWARAWRLYLRDTE